MLVLYNPRSAPTKARIPMSIAALAAVLEGTHPYEIVDGNIEQRPLQRIEEILQAGAGPHMLLCTVMPGPQLAQAVPHCRSLRAAHPDLTIVWGGYFPSMHAETTLRSGYVNYVVLGQGEATLLELLAVLAHGGSLAGVDGLCYLEGGGIRRTRPRTLIDPNGLPMFPYHRLRMDRYLGRTFMGARTACHHSSVSCPFPCSFCAVIKVYGRGWLAETPARLERTVRHLRDTYRADAVEFYDNNFFTKEGRTAEFAERIRDLGIGWWGEGRVDTLLKYSDRTWQLMRAAGLRSLFMGAESGSAAALAEMQKDPLDIHQTLAIAKRCVAYGVVPEFSFVLGNPRNPRQDILETIAFIYKVKAISPECEISLYLYTPMPGGEMYDEAVALGFAYPDSLEEWVSERWLRFSSMRDPQTPWLTAGDMTLVRNFETVLQARFPSHTDIALGKRARTMLRGLSWLRYRTRFYRSPLELRAALAAVKPRHPQLEGF